MIINTIFIHLYLSFWIFLQNMEKPEEEPGKPKYTFLDGCVTLSYFPTQNKRG